MKKDSGYWEERIAKNTWTAYNNLEERNRKLLELYQTASRNIREELYTIAEKYSKDGVLTLSEMYRENRLKKLEIDYVRMVEELGRKVEKAVVSNMQVAYADVYSDTGNALGVDFTIPSNREMDSVLKEPWHGRNFSSSLWGGKNAQGAMQKLSSALDSELVYGLQTGKTVTQIAISLNNIMQKGFNAAHTLVRTESMHYMNTAALQSYKDAEIKYVKVIAAADERTCDTCGVYHGKIYPIDKCPILPFHPNCRCTIIPVIEDSFNKDTIVESDLLKSKSLGLKLSNDVYKAAGMTQDLKIQIQRGVEKLQKEYDVHADGILSTSLGEDNKTAFFATVPYRKEGRKIGYLLVINTDYDYTNFKRMIKRRYEAGYFAGKSVEDYVSHEMAHIMTFQDCDTELLYNTRKQLVDTYFVENISGYSDRMKSGTESIAEAFVKMRNGEYVPGEIKSVVKYYIERWKK